MSLTSQINVDRDFLRAADALENLHEMLAYPTTEQSVTDVMDRIESFYREGSEEVRYEVLTRLVDMEYVGVRALLRQALQSDSSALVRHEAAFGLGIMGQPSDASLLAGIMLNDDNLMVRHEAAVALAEVGNESILGELESASRDKSPEVSASARFAIQSIYLRAYRDLE